MGSLVLLLLSLLGACSKGDSTSGTASSTPTPDASAFCPSCSGGLISGETAVHRPEALGVLDSGSAVSPALLDTFKVSNALCARAYVTELSVDDEICGLEEKDTPPEVAKLLEKIRGLHERVARLLKQDPVALFAPEVPSVPARAGASKGIRLLIRNRAAGVLESSYSSRNQTITMTQFSDPNVTLKEAFNDGVYVHELGHHLSLISSKVLPRIIHDMQSNPAFMEGFADWLALSVTGSVFSDSVSSPFCQDKSRRVTSYQSFNYPDAYFRAEYAMLKLRSCCEDRKERGLLEPVIAPACEMIVQRVDALRLKNPDLFDFESEFQISNYWAQPMNYDIHQLGIPLNSFFKKLAKSAGSQDEAVVESLVSASRESSLARFTCRLSGAPDRQFVATHSSAATFLADFKTHALNREHGLQSVYDAEYKRHGLGKLLELSKESESRAAVNAARVFFETELLNDLKTTGSARCLNASQTAGNFDTPECHILCERM